METVIFEAPALYGDHHVSEARRILFEMPGVGEAYVSSAFQVIEVTFDPARIKAEQIEARLQEAGYLGAIRTPTEAASRRSRPATTRSSATPPSTRPSKARWRSPSAWSGRRVRSGPVRAWARSKSWKKNRGARWQRSVKSISIPPIPPRGRC